MNQITESQLRPTPAFKPHTWRHIISGTIVFMSGIVVDQTLAYFREKAPVNVHWIGETGQRQLSFHKLTELPTNQIFSVDFGISTDGRVVWRVVKQ
jgi:hypothetical protein